MFDRVFFKFAVGFVGIIATSMCLLYFSGHFDGSATQTIETAAVAR